MSDIKKKTTRNLPAGDRMALNKTARIKKNKIHVFITKKEVLIGNIFFLSSGNSSGILALAQCCMILKYLVIKLSLGLSLLQKRETILVFSVEYVTSMGLCSGLISVLLFCSFEAKFAMKFFIKEVNVTVTGLTVEWQEPKKNYQRRGRKNPRIKFNGVHYQGL